MTGQQTSPGPDADAFALGGVAEDDTATTEQYAAIEFEPMLDLEGVEQSLSWARWQKDMANIRVNAAFAVKIVGKTKPELVEAVAKLGGDSFLDMAESLHESSEFLKALVALVAAAHVRAMVAVSAYALSADNEGEPTEGAA